jgi:hypothetical protein
MSEPPPVDLPARYTMTPDEAESFYDAYESRRSACEHERFRQIGPDDFQCTDCGEVIP